jgi:hypothetical protein
MARSKEVRISFHGDDYEDLLATPIDGNVYLAEESSLLGEVQYHDVMEAETQPDGTLHFLRVLSRSGLKTEYRIVPESYFATDSLSQYLSKVMTIGGNWEKTFGGVLVLHLPIDKADSMLLEFTAIFDALRGHIRNE